MLNYQSNYFDILITFDFQDLKVLKYLYFSHHNIILFY